MRANLLSPVQQSSRICLLVNLLNSTINKLNSTTEIVRGIFSNGSIEIPAVMEFQDLARVTTFNVN
jgi:hypothetical protein